MHGLGQIGGDAGDDVALKQVDQRGAAAAAQNDGVHAERRGDINNSVGGESLTL